MRLLSLEVYTETTQKHAFIGYSCLDLAHGGWPFGMGSNGLAHTVTVFGINSFLGHESTDLL